MLTIDVNGKPLDLTPNQGFEIVSSNPSLDKDRIDRSFSFPFNIPFTANNLRVRNHAHRLDAKNERDTGRVAFGGHLLLKGELRQMSTTLESEEVNISSDPINVWELMRTIKVHEILDTIDITSVASVLPVWWFVCDVPPNIYQIKIGDGIFIYDSVPGDLSFDVVTALAALINAVYPGMATAQATNVLLLESEQINTYEIDLTITNHLTLDNVVTLGERAMENMRTHVDDTLATPIASHCFPIIRWADLYPSGGNPIFFDWVNMAIDGNSFQNNPEVEKRWSNTFMPLVKVPYILGKIAEQIGSVGWVGDVFDGEIIQDLIVVSNYTLDKLYFDRYEEEPGRSAGFYFLNGFEQVWSLNDCVPQMTAAEFVLSICQKFQFNVEFGDGALAFSKAKNTVDRPAINLDGKISAKYKTGKNKQTGWTLQYGDYVFEKGTYDGDLAPRIVGDGEVKNVIARTLPMQDEYPASLGGLLKTPITKSPGAARVFSSSSARNSMPLTFLLNRGTQMAELGGEYLMASSDTTDYAGDPIGDYALTIGGDAGLLKQWHNGIIEYSDGDPISITAVMSIGDLQLLLSWGKSKVTFYHPNGQVTGLIRSVRAKMAGANLEPVQIEIVTKRST